MILIQILNIAVGIILICFGGIRIIKDIKNRVYKRSMV